ncbi:MAG: DNA repair protein RecO [Lachnospiraceae bacterium]|nr:DNA repair protein RecO [Lachnospiraceae bacterium]
MQELFTVTGMILKAEPFGEYDRRVVMLTKERGKIAAFAKGARKQGSRLLAATNPFCFGEFKLFAGRTSYTISEAVISNYFEGLRGDYEGACYGMYFNELADYYTRENNDEREVLKLLYQSLRGLMHTGLDNRLVRYIFEIKALVIAGEYPGIPEGSAYQESTLYTLEFIRISPVEKLYTFTVSDAVLSQLKEIADSFRHRFIDRKMKSLQILNEITEIPC